MKHLALSLVAIAAMALTPSVMRAQDARVDSTDTSSRRIGQWIITRESTYSSDPDGDSTSSSVSYNISGVHGFTPHLPLFSIGFSGFVASPLTTISSPVTLNEAKSWEWGVMIPLDGFTIGRSEHFGVGSAIGFGRTTYKFADTRCFLTEPATRVTRFAYPSTPWDETRLRYWTLRLPIMFEYRTSPDGLFAGIGPELEYRFSGISLGRSDGMKKSDVITRDLDFHPLGVNLLAQLGYGDISVMARASLVELFAHSIPATQVYPVSLVFGLCF